MFKRKIDFEVVPEAAYAEFDYPEQERMSERTGALIGASIAATASLATYAVTRYTNPTLPAAVVNPTSIPPIIEPLNVFAQLPAAIPVSSMTPEMIPVGLVADTSLEMLANVLDPLLQIMVAISFPIASVIMVGSCFFFMFGNSEKAWGNIMKAGLGYVVIQLSPLFLTILRNVGQSVIPQ